MNKRSRIVLAVFATVFPAVSIPELAAGAEKWDFSGQAQLTKPKIEAFMNRSVAHFETLSFQSFSQVEFDRTKAFFLRTGAKFVHGAELSWGKAYPDHDYWDKCKLRMADLHGTRGLQDIIVEGFIAEHMGANADTTVIPPWLWQYMQQNGLVAKRKPSPNDRGDLHYFHYDNFFDSDWPHIDRWAKGQSVPDITKIETQLYFRYMLKEYIDAGFESIWFGGLALVGANDADGKALSEVCKFAKEYAAKNGRRRGILLTSHVGGWAHNGKQLLDYICFPSRVRYTETYSHGLEINPAMPDVRELIGLIENPADLPFMLEIDNYACQTDKACICSGGYDEITGFAQKPPLHRRDFLKQYYHEVRNWPNVWCNNRVYLCMPGRRYVCTPGCTGARQAAGTLPYPGNNYSPYREHCGDEETIAGLFNNRIKPRPAAAAKRDAKGAAPAASTAAKAKPEPFHETFDEYPDGPVGGQGRWEKKDRSSRMQAEFVSGKTGRALEQAPDQAGGTLNDKLALPSIQGGICTLSFDMAFKGDPKAHPTSTFTRIDFFSAAPDAEARPGGIILRMYWGSPARIVHQGDQSVDVIAAPVSGRWYRIALKFNLDGLTVDVSVDGKTVADKLPLRDCRPNGLGPMTMTTWAMGSNMRVYLDNVTLQPAP